MTIYDAILVAAIGLELFGIVQAFRTRNEFWSHPTGNLIAGVGFTVVTNAVYPLSLQDDGIMIVVLALVLFWFSKTTVIHQPARRPRAATFEQIFETVEVEPRPEGTREPFVEDFGELSRTVEPVVEPVDDPVLMWRGA